MKTYEEPQLEMILLESQDVVCATSNEDDETDL